MKLGDFTIERLRRGDQTRATYGVIKEGDEPFGVTLERPWRNNAPNVSCIPSGVYVCTWSLSNRFKVEMWEIQGVPGRSGVRIHWGAEVAHTEGCPLVAEMFAVVNGQTGIDMSRRVAGQGYHEFIARTRRNDRRKFTLCIIDPDVAEAA